MTCAQGASGFEMLNGAVPWDRSSGLRLGSRAEVSGAFAFCFLLSYPGRLSTAQAQAGLGHSDFFLVHRRENINVPREWPRGRRKRDPVTQSLACMSPKGAMAGHTGREKDRERG